MPRDRSAIQGRWRITENNGTVRVGGFKAALNAERKGKKVEIIPTKKQRRNDQAHRDANIGAD